MFIGICIGYNANRILYTKIRIEILSLTKISSIPNNISEIFSLDNLVDPYTWVLFYRFSITDTTKESCHGNLPYGFFVSTKAERILVRAPEMRVSYRYLYWL